MRGDVPGRIKPGVHLQVEIDEVQRPVASPDPEIPLPRPVLIVFLYPVLDDGRDVDAQPMENKSGRPFIAFAARVTYNVDLLRLHGEASVDLRYLLIVSK